jgi:hypothetical protein
MRTTVTIIAVVGAALLVVGCGKKDTASSGAVSSGSASATPPSNGASGAAAADGWVPYHNASYGFSVEAPMAVALTPSTADTAVGKVPLLNGMADMGPKGVVGFTVGDYTGLPVSDDVDASLEGAVKGEASTLNATMDSETTITVDGAPAREVNLHTDKFIMRSRIVRSGSHIYTLSGIGYPGTGVPAEYDRFAASFKLDK